MLHLRNKNLIKLLTLLFVVAEFISSDVLAQSKTAATILKQEQLNYDRTYAEARAGNADSMYSLAVKLAVGNGVTKNESEAVKWYQSSAVVGYKYAMFKLGCLYTFGKGVEKDPLKAENWFRAFDEADGNRPETSTKMSDSHAKAICERHNSEIGEAQGMFLHGILLAQGLSGYTKNEKEAVKLFRAAAEAGNENGMFWLGDMLANGQGTPKNPIQAQYWWRKVATESSGINAEAAVNQLQRKYGIICIRIENNPNNNFKCPN